MKTTDRMERLSKLSPEQRAMLMEALWKQSAQSEQANVITPRPDKDLAPLSFAQQRLWFFDQLEPGSPAYNIPSAVRLSGLLNVKALEQCLNEIQRRHETLRASFSISEGKPVQVIRPAESAALPWIDISELSDTDRELSIRDLTTREAYRLFSLEQGELFRAQLIHLNESEHVLLLTMHHIVSDGWSMGVLIGELAALYEAFASARPSPLPELAIQYADFAQWQKQWLQGEVLETQMRYWKEQLAGRAAALELPTDAPRPPIQTFRGAHQSLTLSATLTDEISALSSRQGATLFMTLLAAFKCLIYRYTGQEDILIGTPIANRNRAETEAIIGFFVNTLIIRTDLSGNPTFNELLNRVKETALGAFTHQDLPFEKLVEELQPERDLSRQPLFQVMFILQNAPMPSVELPGLRITPIEPPTQVEKFDMTLTVMQIERVTRVKLQYNTDLFKEATIKGLLRRFEVLLESIIANPNCRISELPILTEAERIQLLAEWNNTKTELVPDGCIHQLFEERVRRAPDRVAAEYADERLTYAELNRQANQLAHYLRHLGVGPEVVVGIYIERSLTMIIGLLGVLKAGAAYVPLDLLYPKERLAFILDETEMSVLLSQQHLLERLPAERATIVCLDTDKEAIAEQSAENLSTGAVADNMAYIIYTSGSTGRAKGVMGTHRASLNRFDWMWKAFPFLPGEVCCLKTSLSFVDSVWELFGPLLQGVRLVIIPADVVKDPPLLVNLLSEQGVSRLVLVPSLLRAILTSAQDLAARLPELKYCVSSGEALPTQLWQEFEAALPQARLLNLYGSSEVAADASYYQGKQGEERRGQASMPIGKAITNLRLYLLDESGQVVPAGVVAELHIGGAGLARGYMRDAVQTAAKFVPDELSGEKGARLYQSGDMGRQDGEGVIEYVGRKDRQVKVRGIRIELEEIETALRSHEDISETAVVARDNAEGDLRIVAYIVPEREQAPGIRELRSYLLKKLPEYMVPSAFVSIQHMPKTASGKLDRRALPAYEKSGLRLEEGYIAPRTQMEEIIAGIWCEVLGVEQVGVYENFFDIGGHSLLATQIMSRATSSFQVALPLRILFESPTVAALAERIDDERGAETKLDLPPLRPVSRSTALPLSFAQQRLWFLDQLEPGNPAYNMFGAIRLSGHLKPAALEQALGEILRRHEVLRTAFHSLHGRPLQVISPAQIFTLLWAEISEFPEAEQEAEVRKLASQEAQRPFDLTSAPLFRAQLIHLNESEHVLLLTMHHIVSDGWSMGVLIGELAALYEAFASARPSPLPELAIQYADFAQWQKQWLQGEVLETQMRYWKEQLAGRAAALELPTDAPRPPIQTFRGARERYLIPASDAQALKAVSRKEGVTLFMLLLAAFDALLYRYTGQEDICVGTPIANRRWVETEGLIGFFANTLVMRGNLSGDPTFSDLLKQIREAALGAYAHQDLPFEKLVEVLQPDRDTSRHPLFQVMLALQNAPLPNVELPGLRLQFLDADSRTARFDLLLGVTDTPQGLVCALEYNADLFAAETMKRLLAHFHILLERVMVDTQQRLSELVRPIPAQKLRIVVASTFTAKPLEDSLAFWAEQLLIPNVVQFAPYGQVFQHLLDPCSLLANNSDGLNIILLRLEDWCQGRLDSDDVFFNMLEENVDNFLASLESSRTYMQARCLIGLCPSSDSVAADPAKLNFIMGLESLISMKAKRLGGIEVLNYPAIIRAYDVQKVNDANTDEIGHIPYTSEFFAALGTAIARKLLALSEPRHKVILLDCDETLWSGACGEDGPCNIELLPPYLELQQFMLKQHESGSLLCLCSKNSEPDVIETFRIHSEMPLKLKHFAAWRINWEPTSSNLISLSNELLVPLEEMIYISRNPVEYAQVRVHNPEVLTLRLPSDPQEIPLFLNHLWIFDPKSDAAR